MLQNSYFFLQFGYPLLVIDLHIYQVCNFFIEFINLLDLMLLAIFNNT